MLLHLLPHHGILLQPVFSPPVGPKAHTRRVNWKDTGIGLAWSDFVPRFSHMPGDIFPERSRHVSVCCGLLYAQ